MPGADGYEYVSVSGSYMKKRVKTGTSAAQASDAATVSAEQFRKAIERPRGTPQGPALNGN